MSLGASAVRLSRALSGQRGGLAVLALVLAKTDAYVRGSRVTTCEAGPRS